MSAQEAEEAEGKYSKESTERNVVKVKRFKAQIGCGGHINDTHNLQGGKVSQRLVARR